MRVYSTSVVNEEEIELADNKILLADNEYVIMSEVVENEYITQRELSKKLGVSVSTVNVLMNKMIREGLIKMTQVSQKQVLYMLTPVGMMEKAKKTVSYLKGHYRAIFETKEKVKLVLDKLEQDYDPIFILTSDDEMGEILRIAVQEFQSKHSKSKIKIIHNKYDLATVDSSSSILLHMNLDEEALTECDCIENLAIVNLLEYL